MRRKGHPSFPNAITCCFFSSLKTLLMPREPIRAPLGVNVPGSAMAGFQPTSYGRFWVTTEVPRFGCKANCRDLMFSFNKRLIRRGEPNFIGTRNRKHIPVVVFVGPSEHSVSTNDSSENSFVIAEVYWNFVDFMRPI